MRIRVRLFLLASLLASPAAASAQFGVGAHLGTTGFGVDLAVALGGNAQVRGTAGIMPIEPSWTVSDIDVTAELPNSFIMAGIDLFPSGSGFRLGAGVLFKPDDPILTGELSGPTRVGDQTYTPAQVGTLTGTVESREAAPYLMIGFGKHASAGIGLFVDLGAAFVGESTIDLQSRGGTLSGNPQFQAELAREEAEWQERIDEFEIYPILNLGLRVGIGN
jgi:hypothetical protein